MDTLAQKTPATLPFAAWQAMTPATAAREVHARIAALPAALRSAALAWVRPEIELAAALERSAKSEPVGVSPPAAQTPHPFQGLPYLLKDLFDLAGVPTKAGSTFLEQVRPTTLHDCRIAQRFHELGAACAGKTHLVEFASGLTGENPHYGDCPHPQFPDRLSGGSSSGSAALVAAGVVPLSIGTDTGGSIRVPAAFCGLYGFRMTPGQEWITDAFPLAPTMDTAGWFTATSADLLTTWRALVGESDATTPTRTTPRGGYVPMNVLLPNGESEFAHAHDGEAARYCSPVDAQTQALLLNSWQDSVDAYLTIGMSEANGVHRDWLAPYREHYDPVIWERFHDAGNYPPGQVARARAKLEEVRAAFRTFFMDFDYLILPATPSAAPHKADCTVELRRSIIKLTAPASLGGLPVLSVPVPLASGITGGLQIIVPAANSPVVPWILTR